MSEENNYWKRIAMLFVLAGFKQVFEKATGVSEVKNQIVTGGKNSVSSVMAGLGGKTDKVVRLD